MRLTLALLLLTMTVGCSSQDASETSTSAGSATSTSEVTSTSAPVTTTTSSTPTSTSTTLIPAETTLLVLGDWGSGTLPEGAVAGAIQRHAENKAIEAILTTGDNFYSDDWKFLIEPYRWAIDQGIPFWITWGNHDVESQERIEAVNEAFSDPPRWTVRKWGPIDVIILDSTEISSPEQAAFFLDAMDNSDAPTIVAVHHPPFSCAHHPRVVELVSQFVDRLDDDVVLVLSGHDHVYQRFERNGVAYVVTGGGGRKLYDLSDCPANHPEPLAGVSTHHFLSVDQTETGLELTAIDVNGNVIDQFEVAIP